MVQMVFSILDRVAAEYGPVFTAKNEEVAMRQFKYLMTTEAKDNMGDFSLIKVGHFDNESGKLESIGTNEEVDG